ncbi:hypothetical protein [Maioricimonas rarisocia]|nr:hypothetical protein [Maioricimonas rarisocia]
MRTLKAYTCWGTPCSVEIDEVGNVIRVHGTGVRSIDDVLKLADPDGSEPAELHGIESTPGGPDEPGAC